MTILNGGGDVSETRCRGKEGFTLIEILLVVIIVGTLAAMMIPRLTGRSDQARKAAAKADVSVNIPTALKLYELDNGFFPSTDQGLRALTKKPSSSPVPQNWNGPYLEKMPVDPWGRPYQYESPGTNRPHDYDLFSRGKKPKPPLTDDDIINW
jgi:general secretion pathway protein G